MNTVDAYASDEIANLMSAAQNSLGFWDNPMDNEDWNDATPG